MHASRRTQPYRKGQPRQAGLALKAMGKGRTATGFNPADIQRGLQKGSSGSRQMHKPVDLTPAPAKGTAPKVTGGLARKLNRTGNERDGQIYREVRGKSKAGVTGTWHEYVGGRKVFVADKGAKPRQTRAKSFAKRATRTITG